MRNLKIPEKHENNPKEINFCFLICGFNTQLWILFNLRSIFCQKYRNFRVVFVDDCSIDSTVQVVSDFINENNLHNFITVISNEKNYGPAYSRFIGLQQITDDEIVVFLDADDWLFTDQVLNILLEKYLSGYQMTFGSFIHFNKLRQVKFRGGGGEIDYQKPARYHLRSGYKYLWKDMEEDYIKDSDGNFIKYCTDFNELMWAYCKLEKNKICCVEQTLIVYNTASTTTESNPSEYKLKILNELKERWLKLHHNYGNK